MLTGPLEVGFAGSVSFHTHDLGTFFYYQHYIMEEV